MGGYWWKKSDFCSATNQKKIPAFLFIKDRNPKISAKHLPSLLPHPSRPPFLFHKLFYWEKMSSSMEARITVLLMINRSQKYQDLKIQIEGLWRKPALVVCGYRHTGVPYQKKKKALMPTEAKYQLKNSQLWFYIAANRYSLLNSDAAWLWAARNKERKHRKINDAFCSKENSSPLSNRVEAPVQREG